MRTASDLDLDGCRILRFSLIASEDLFSVSSLELPAKNILFFENSSEPINVSYCLRDWVHSCCKLCFEVGHTFFFTILGMVSREKFKNTSKVYLDYSKL